MLPPLWHSASAMATHWGWEAPSASAIATRFATHWGAEALASDESFDFSVLQDLLRTSSEPIAAAPEATRERLALRTLQEVSALVPAGGDAAAAAGLLRGDAAPSCEDALSRLVTELEISGKLEKDLLACFSQDIQETIRTKRLTLPETSFQLLKGVDSWITSVTPTSQLEHNSTEDCANDQTLCSSDECVQQETGHLPECITAQDTIMISQPDSRKAHPSALQHERGENVNQDLEDVSASIRPVEKDHAYGDLTLQSASASIPSSSKDRDRESAKKTSNEEESEDTSPEISVRSKDQDINDTLEGLSQPDVCIKCGKDGELLTCSDCSLAAHDSCFGSSVTFEGTDLLYCPVCSCKKAKEDYSPPQRDATDAVGLGARSLERSPIVERNMSVGSVLASVGCDARLQGSCNGANQGSTSETNLQPGAATEDRMAFEEQNADQYPEVSGANKANQVLHDDGSIMKNNTTHGGLTAQTASVSQNYNVTLHDKTSEGNCFSEQKNGENGTDVQKDNCRTSLPSSSKDRDRESAKKTSNEEKSEDTSLEISVHSKDEDIDDTLEGLSQQDLCIKCGKGAELLTCSDCSLDAHDSCFGSSVAFEGTDLCHCPVCSYKKAEERYLKEKKRYLEAKEKSASYAGTARVSKQHDEQLNGVQPGAAKRDGHSNVSDTSKRNSIHQNEAYDLAPQDEEPHQSRKKQKINAGGSGYPKEVLNEKVPFQNSGPASMNKRSVLQNKRKTRVEDPEKKQQVGDKEAGKPRKRSSVRPQKRYSKPVAPLGRRKKLFWTEEEEAILRDGMAKFAPQDDAPIPWKKILAYGCDVFHKSRSTVDLKDKWRNMMKTDAGK